MSSGREQGSEADRAFEPKVANRSELLRFTYADFTIGATMRAIMDARAACPKDGVLGIDGEGITVYGPEAAGAVHTSTGIRETS